MKKILMILVLCLILLNGCIGTPKYIGQLSTIEDAGTLKVSFSFFDSSNNYVKTEGKAIIKIKNDKGKEVFSEVFDVTKENFKPYTHLLTNKMMEVCIIDIPISKIQKSDSSFGKLYLIFNTKSGMSFEEIETGMWSLPVLSQKELDIQGDIGYSKSSVLVNQVQSKGNFEVTVKNAGTYTKSDLYSGEEECFRIDLAIKNKGNEKEYFLSYGFVLLDNQGNQYETIYGGTLDSVDIHPSVTKEGYVLFESIPPDLDYVKLIFELGYDENWNPYEFNFGITL